MKYEKENMDKNHSRNFGFAIIMVALLGDNDK